MNARSLRGPALLAALLAGAIWITPALLVSALAASLGERAGVALELETVRPTLPLGVSAAKATLRRGEAALELGEVRAVFSLSGLRAHARVGDGELALRSDGISMRADHVRAQSLPLERFSAFMPPEFALRGNADGVLRFGAPSSLELTVSRGALLLRAPLVFELDFAQLVIAAEREPDGSWRVDYADLRGPPFSASATGRIGAEGELALSVEVTRLDEPARSAFGLAGLPTDPIPYRAELGGTLAAPIFSALGAAGR